MTERPAGLPSPQQVIELLAGEFARVGCEIEDVNIDVQTTSPRITVVADSDKPLDLDTVAELSRAASELMDELDTGELAYVLEVTSRGVDRPLTSEKHFRRARGRLVEVELVGGDSVRGRIGEVSEESVSLVVRDRKELSIRQLKPGEILKAVVQVEFSPPNARELEMVNGSGAGTEVEA